MLDTLRRLVQAVANAENLDRALNIIVVRIKEIMQTGVCSVYLFDEVRCEWVLMATDGLNPESVRVASLRKAEGLVGTVGSRGELINLDDAPSHPSFCFIRETGEEIFHSFLGVPIVHERTTLGVLVVQQTAPRRFSIDEEALLVTVAAQLSALIAHAKVSGRFNLQSADSNADIHFKGVSGVAGVAIGKAFVRQPPANLRRVREHKTSNPDRDLNDFQSALSRVQEELREISESLSEHLETKETALFDTYLRMLEDHTLSGEVFQRIRSGESAQTALKHVVLDLVARFESMDDPYLKERSTDLMDLGRRILAKLLQEESEEFSYPDELILVAEDVTPVMLGEVDRSKLKGIISMKGSANSHTAILAKSLQIPAVMGALDLPLSELNGSRIIVDGWRSNVVVNPTDAVIEEYQTAIDEAAHLYMDLEKIESGPACTTDGQHIHLMLNSGPFGELTPQQESWIDGVGLYRTEFVFLSRSRFPSEDEQEVEYRKELSRYAPNPVVIRTLDIGGDKPLPYFSIDEENPFLGWRGVRVTLDHPEIFLTQIRAMLKASAGLQNLRILLPMITLVEELRASKELIYRVVDELNNEGFKIETPKIGVMIEVPSAVYMADELADECDFLSVGSNDLTQYLLAVDRTNALVADMFDAYHPSVLRALQRTCYAGSEAAIPLALCGEMAGEPMSAVLLVGLGFTELSMSASSLGLVKKTLSTFSIRECQTLASRAVKCSTSQAVSLLLRDAFQQKKLDGLLSPIFLGLRNEENR